MTRLNFYTTDGMFFAIPLRKFYILKLKLVYPSGAATAFTIRSLHVGQVLTSFI
jgi:uncharacterized oligopeptide transporter (OPT) family protein